MEHEARNGRPLEPSRANDNNLQSQLLRFKGDLRKGKTMPLCGTIDEFTQHKKG